MCGTAPVFSIYKCSALAADEVVQKINDWLAQEPSAVATQGVGCYPSALTKFMSSPVYRNWLHKCPYPALIRKLRALSGSPSLHHAHVPVFKP